MSTSPQARSRFVGLSRRDSPNFVATVRGILLGVACVWLVACTLTVRDCTWDDSYIGFRYARNIADGFGPIFNTGQRVEGYTDFLWVLLTAAGTKLTADPILAAKFLGILFNLSALPACYFLCRLLAKDRIPMCGVALLLTVSNSHFIAGTVSGLETPLFTSILAWSLVAYLRAIQDKTSSGQARWLVLSSVLFALLTLTRPDGILTYALIWCYSAWKFRHQPQSLLWLTAPMILIYAPYFCWRWHYYGFLFPNTFYVKRGGTLALLLKGVTQTGKFLGYQTGGWFVTLIVILAVLSNPTAETTVLGLAVASRVMFDLWSGGVSAGEFRFLVSALPLIWILTEYVLGGSLEGFGLHLSFLSLSTVAAALLVIAQGAMFWHDRSSNIKQVELGMSRAHIAVGKWLADNSPRGATIAVGDIGAIGYWSRRNIIDLDGLTDSHISHLPGALSEKRDPEYVLGQAPEFIVLRTSSCTPGLTEVSFGTDKSIFSAPRFTRDYRQERCWEFWPKLNLLMYRRRAQ